MCIKLIIEVKRNMELLVKSDLDFVSSKILEDDKSSSWITTNYVKFVKVMLWIFYNFDKMLENKFSNSNFNIKNYNSKICMAYLKLHNLEVSKKLDEKRAVVENHRKSMDQNLNDLRNTKVLPIMFNSHKLLCGILS